MWYYQFPDLARLRAAYTAQVTRSHVASNTGACNATTWLGEVTRPPAGRVLCYSSTADGRTWVEWTNESLLIYARANAPSARVLQDWFTKAAGPS